MYTLFLGSLIYSFSWKNIFYKLSICHIVIPDTDHSTGNNNQHRTPEKQSRPCPTNAVIINQAKYTNKQTNKQKQESRRQIAEQEPVHVRRQIASQGVQGAQGAHSPGHFTFLFTLFTFI